MAFCSIRIGSLLIHIFHIHFPVVQSVFLPPYVSYTMAVPSLIVVMTSFIGQTTFAAIGIVITN